MKIAIIKRSQLNGCWSALQYTDSCHLCDKVLTCKIVSQHHKNGIIDVVNTKRNNLLKEVTERISSIEKQAREAIKIFEA